MESPLIPRSDEGVLSGAEEGREQGLRRRCQVLVEVKKQAWLAGPLIAANLLQYILQVISVMFVGHLGELALSGASMATSFAAVTGFSLMEGMASVLDTLCGQAFGAKQYYILGIQLQRAILVLTLVNIPISIVWANTDKILILCGQDVDISMEAGLYARWLIPALIAFGLIQCHNRFLQAQNIVFPMMLSAGFTALLHIFMCWILVFKLHLGIKGAALANVISNWINVILLSLYIWLSPACKHTWTGFSKQALHNLLNFVTLAVPSTVMLCLEWWSFELIVLLSGLLPNPKLETSVLSISLNTLAMLYSIPFGLGSAISTRVSNELGAGRPYVAQLVVHVAVFTTNIQALIIGLIMFLVRGIWGYAYSNEREVVNYVATMMPILAASYFLNGMQCALSGVARGCGWQKTAAFINLGAYYIVGVPSAVLLAFVHHIGGKGLWMGIICGLGVQVVLLIIITFCTNWENEAKKAKDRLHNSTSPMDMAT